MTGRWKRDIKPGEQWYVVGKGIIVGKVVNLFRHLPGKPLWLAKTFTDTYWAMYPTMREAKAAVVAHLADQDAPSAESNFDLSASFPQFHTKESP